MTERQQQSKPTACGSSYCRVALLGGLVFSGLLFGGLGCRGEVEASLPDGTPRLLRQEAAGCDRGEALACNNVAAAIEAGETALGEVPAPDSPQAAQARALYQRACEGGAQLACLNVANQLLAGAGGAADPTRAVSLLEQACDGQELIACLRLAHLFRDGVAAQGGHTVVARDSHRALTLYAAVCDAGVFEGCVSLAAELEDDGGQSGPNEASLGQALALYTRACEAGFPDGCTGRALLQLREPSIAARTPDTERARAVLVLERACFGGSARACATAAVALADGMAELPADAARAAALQVRGCALGDVALCDVAAPPDGSGAP